MSNKQKGNFTTFLASRRETLQHFQLVEGKLYNISSQWKGNFTTFLASSEGKLYNISSQTKGNFTTFLASGKETLQHFQLVEGKLLRFQLVEGKLLRFQLVQGKLYNISSLWKGNYYVSSQWKVNFTRVLLVKENFTTSGGNHQLWTKIKLYRSSVVGSIGVISGGLGFHELIHKYGIERRVFTAGSQHKNIIRI